MRIKNKLRIIFLKKQALLWMTSLIAPPPLLLPDYFPSSSIPLPNPPPQTSSLPSQTPSPPLLLKPSQSTTGFRRHCCSYHFLSGIILHTGPESWPIPAITLYKSYKKILKFCWLIFKFDMRGRKLGCLVGRPAGLSVSWLPWIPKRAGSFTSMLLSEHLFVFLPSTPSNFILELAEIISLLITHLNFSSPLLCSPKSLNPV